MKHGCLISVLATGMIFGIGLLLVPGCGSAPADMAIWRSRSLSGVHNIDLQSSKNSNVSVAEKLYQFERAGPIRPTTDVSELMRACRVSGGLYCVVPGDVLEFRMPAILRVVTPEMIDSLGQIEPYICRVTSSGTIPIPIVGSIMVAGRSIDQVEAMIASAYYPKYVNMPPAVVGKVVSYREARISILGAVNEPGSYLCHSDEMTLVNLIMKAKGIVNDGAAVIRICRADDANGNNAVVLPVKGLNIPFADVALNEGDIVEVEQLNPQVFTVIGLVNKSGVFSYPPGVRYNLMQALAFAGGVNKIAAPRYARVYRQCADGSVISASFRLKGTSPVDAANLVIKPGDIVAVEQTFSTQTRLLFAQIFRVTTGLNAFATYRLDTSFEDATSRSND